VVTGPLGGSILGKHLDFTPRVREARLLAERYDIRAAIDISDGLAIDLSRLAAESRCGARLDLRAIPIAAAAIELSQTANDGLSPLDHALSDGEDFELLLAVAPEAAANMLDEQPLAVEVSAIGECVSEPGLWQRDAGDRVTPLAPRGYLHEFD
jgi:thiamine-monophosphate kinase